MRVFECDEAVAIAFEASPQIVAPAWLLAVGKTSAYREASERRRRSASEL